jgi:hypothetical protein
MTETLATLGLTALDYRKVFDADGNYVLVQDERGVPVVLIIMCILFMFVMIVWISRRLCRWILKSFVQFIIYLKRL